MYLLLKRLGDVVISFLSLLVLQPVFLIIICAIILETRGPILFKQKRVGKHKTHFNILKFRTMRVGTPANTPTHLLNNSDQYITKVGRILRKSSLDELPQLINILIGNMSIIGPRPALWNQYDLIAERDKYGVNDILPGLTGWAQINGRDEIPIKLKAKLDGEYASKMSLAMDLRCFIGTIRSVISGKGIVEGMGKPTETNIKEANSN